MLLAGIHGIIVLLAIVATGVDSASDELAAVTLAALSVGVDASSVLVVASLLASTWDSVLGVGWALLGVGIVVDLEVVAALVVAVVVVAGQAWKLNVTKGIITSVTLGWAVRLLAHTVRSWDWDDSGGRGGGGGASSGGGGGSTWANRA